jgi:hypothetical protein
MRLKSLKYDSIRPTQHIYSLITIRLATCFEPTGLSSGLHHKPVDIRKLRIFLGSQTMFTKHEYKRLFLSLLLHRACCYVYFVQKPAHALLLNTLTHPHFKTLKLLKSVL